MEYSDRINIPADIFFEQKTHVCNFKDEDGDVDQINLIEMTNPAHPKIYILYASLQTDGLMPGTQINTMKTVQLNCTDLETAVAIAPSVYKEIMGELKVQAARARLMIPPQR